MWHWTLLNVAGCDRGAGPGIRAFAHNLDLSKGFRFASAAAAVLKLPVLVGSKDASKARRVCDVQDKTFTCNFSDSFRRSPSYKLFWPDGWASPQILIQYVRASRSASLDFISNMCSEHQPILMQCKCGNCETRSDEVSPSGARIFGCTPLSSPCVKCAECHCDFPEDSYLTDTTRTVISQIAAGLVFSCEDGPGQTGSCQSIFEDLPIKMELDCSTGACIN